MCTLNPRTRRSDVHRCFVSLVPFCKLAWRELDWSSQIALPVGQSSNTLGEVTKDFLDTSGGRFGCLCGVLLVFLADDLVSPTSARSSQSTVPLSVWAREKPGTIPPCAAEHHSLKSPLSKSAGAFGHCIHTSDEAPLFEDGKVGELGATIFHSVLA